MSGDVGKPKVTPLVTVHQSGMVEPQQVEQSGVKVVDMDTVLGDLISQFIGPSECPGPDATSCEPDTEGARMMITPQTRWRGCLLDHRSTSEFSTPDDECLVEQPALFQVLDQRGRGLVDFSTPLRQRVQDILVLVIESVMVPVTMVELDKTDPPLDQAPRQQTIIGKGSVTNCCTVLTQGGR